MNTTNQYTENQLDGLLTSFFTSEKPREFLPCPKPWAERPTPAIAHTQAEPKSGSHRWALAATAAVLIGGLWLASSIGPSKAPDAKIGDNQGYAKTPDEMKLKKAPK